MLWSIFEFQLNDWLARGTINPQANFEVALRLAFALAWADQF
jgi:hypothetical protein